jgi:hypothetical protein
VVTLTACEAWRIGASSELAHRSEQLRQHPCRPAKRLLLVGEGTVVGTGARSSSSSLVGLVARRNPDRYIESRASDSTIFSRVLDQLGVDCTFHMVLIQARGSDVQHDLSRM